MNTPIAQSYRLSPLQQGMLFHHLSGRQPGVDIEQIVCTLREEVRVDAFRAAWQRFAARHSVCRTAFRWEGGETRQDVYVDAPVPLEVIDWRDRDTGAWERDFHAFLAADRERGFELEQPPLMRVTLLRLDQRAWRCVWTFHHLLMDGRSFPVALGEVFALYEAIRDGRELLLPTPGEYREYIEWLEARDPSRDEAFWRDLLRGFRAPTPLGFASSDGSGRGERDASLSVESTLALRAIVDRHGLTMNTIVQGAWALLLARHSGENDVVFGATRAGRYGTVPRADSTLGVFINTLPVRARIDLDRSVVQWLGDLRAQGLAVRAYEHSALVDVMRWSDVPHGSPLFESLIVYDHELLGTTMRSRGGAWATRDARLVERTSFPITLYAYGEDALALKLAYDRPRFCDRAMARALERLLTILEGIASDPGRLLRDLPIMPASERETVLREWNATAVTYERDRCVHELIAQQAAQTPDAVAVRYKDESLTYRELDERAGTLANHLRVLGVGPEIRVGICVERSIEMLVAIVATLKAGGAYVPLDPAYPAGRVEYMLRDAGIAVLITQAALRSTLPSWEGHVLAIDSDWDAIATSGNDTAVREATSANLAYVLYTSGSTGRPKGVMVEHRNVVNFFAGMDERLGTDAGVWLAVTSLSFDISVLELLWTLARGYTVVIHRDDLREQAQASGVAGVRANGHRPMQFSLFYFSADEGNGTGDKYRLLLDGARFADRHGFVAVWTPERHFHAFGGLYPNPSVTGAALAMITQRVSIRSGSVVLPLHHPARVAEEWAVVDNLSHGRVGISFAAGWQPNDFVLRPESFSDAKNILLRDLEVVRQLWRGETVTFPGPNGREVAVRTLPRPVQPELPVWITTSGSADTYRAAGRAGANILTHLLGQSVDEVKAKVALYREAWREAGHAGDGQVSLMLHTFVGEDDAEVKELVRGPLTEYLRTSVGLIKNFADTFPAFKRSGVTVSSDTLQSLSPEEMDALLAWSFERYYETSGLFGTPERCLGLINVLRAAGIDEIACLIDFGIDTDTVLAHLEHLNAVRLRAAEPSHAETRAYSVPALIRRHGVTHLQCTPSMASMLLASDDARDALGQLRVMMVGGEAFPQALAAELQHAVAGRVLNMYGPTETTIWSTTHELDGVTGAVPIGTPIANTQIYILDTAGRPVPPGVPGELFIAGDGVVRGYHERPDLTVERFVPDPFAMRGGARMYRTGDLARWRDDGVVEFLGRLDHQVKVRGHRIELGEIEAVLAEHAGVRDAVAIVREDVPGDVRLVAYVTPTGAPISSAALREYLRELLPDYMVPAHVVQLEAFPLTPNAKIDRKALPAPDIEAVATAAFTSPTTALEESIAEIWREVLGVSRVGVDDNFFDLGGHSLLAIRVHGRLRTALDRDLSITDLFRYPTVRSLATSLARNGDGNADASGQGADRGEARRSAALRRRQMRRGRPAEVNASPGEEQS